MSLDKKVKLTPLMKQYNQIKVKYPDALLLFRVGDFYETFGKDAIKASKILGIILTKKGAGSMSEIELAGFPIILLIITYQNLSKLVAEWQFVTNWKIQNSQKNLSKEVLRN